MKKIFLLVLALTVMFPSVALASSTPTDSGWRLVNPYTRLVDTECLPQGDGWGTYVRAYIGNGEPGTDNFGNLTMRVKRADGTMAVKVWNNTQGSYWSQGDTSRFWYLPKDTLWDDINWAQIEKSGFHSSFQMRFIIGCYV